MSNVDASTTSVAAASGLEPIRPVEGLSRFRRLRRRAFYALVRGLVGVMRHLPRAVAEGALRALARGARTVRRGDRDAVRARVAGAFPALDAAAAHALADRSWDVLAVNLTAMVRADRPVVVDETARARLRAARERGPVLALMAHVGAWELAAHALAAHAAPVGALTADPHNADVDRWLRAERTRRGVTVFDRDTAVGAATRFLRRGGTLVVLADHRPRGAAVDAPWFGRLVPTTTGPGRMARAGRATILPIAVEAADGGFRLVVGDRIDPTGDPVRDAGACNHALETSIRRQPEGWTWLHARTDAA